MTSLNSGFVALFVILANAAFAHGESPDNAMVKSLMEEGLTHGQAVRVTDKVLKSESTSTEERSMDKPQTTTAPSDFRQSPPRKSWPLDDSWPLQHPSK